MYSGLNTLRLHQSSPWSSNTVIKGKDEELGVCRDCTILTEKSSSLFNWFIKTLTSTHTL